LFYSIFIVYYLYFYSIFTYSKNKSGLLFRYSVVGYNTNIEHSGRRFYSRDTVYRRNNV